MSIEIRCYSAEDELLFTYTGKQISEVKLIRQIDPSGLSVPLSTADFVLLLEKQTDYVYEKDQRFEIYLDNSFVSYTVLKDVKRIGNNKLRFYTETILSKLNDLKCIGDYYKGDSSDSNFFNVMDEIMEDSKISYSLHTSFKSEIALGFLPTTRKIDALAHFLLINPLFVDVFSKKMVSFKSFSEETKKIDSSIISSDSYIEEADEDVGFSIEYYSFGYDFSKPFYELQKKLYDTRKALDDGSATAGEKGEITIYFGLPTAGVEVRGGGEKISKSGNKFVFYSDGTATVHGIQREKLSNIKSIGSGSKTIKGMTLVHYGNVDEILERLQNYFKSGKIAHLKIFEGFEKKKNKYGAFKYGEKRYGYNHVRQNRFNVGDKVSFTLWGKEWVARIEKQTFKLTDGVIAKDTVARILEE